MALEAAKMNFYYADREEWVSIALLQQQALQNSYILKIFKNQGSL